MKPLSLTVPKPCAEKWNSFTPTSAGGFCTACNKVVTDFTTLSDEQIITFLSNQSQHVCGRFRPDQLKSYVAAPLLSIRPGFTVLRAGMIGLFVLLVSRPGNARTLHEKPKSEIVFSQSEQVENVASPESIIKGIVKSREDKDPLPGVNVILKGSAQGTITDANGHFEFPVKLTEGDVLLFTFIGFVSKEYKVPKESNQLIEIEMELYMDMDIMGEVAVNEVYQNPPAGMKGIWNKIKSWF